MDSCPRCEKGDGLRVLLTRYTVVNDKKYCHTTNSVSDEYKNLTDEFSKQIEYEKKYRLLQTKEIKIQEYLEKLKLTDEKVYKELVTTLKKVEDEEYAVWIETSASIPKEIEKDAYDEFIEILRELFNEHRYRLQVEQVDDINYDLSIEFSLTNMLITGCSKTLFSTNQYKNISAVGKQKFVQKLLRAGFLYVYNECAGKPSFWEAYQVTDNGYLIPFDYDNDTDMNHSVSNVESCCTADKKIANSLVLTIKRPEDMTNVWFKFSNTKWTNRIKEKYAHKKHIKSNMQCLNVQQWLSGQSDQNYYPLNSHCLFKTVIDFFLPESLNENKNEEVFNINQYLTNINTKSISTSFIRNSMYLHNISSSLLQFTPKAKPLVLLDNDNDNDNDNDANTYNNFKLRNIAKTFDYDLSGKSQEELDSLSINDAYLYAGVIVPIDDMVGLAVDANAYLAASYSLDKELISKEEKTAAIIHTLEPIIRKKAQYDYVENKRDEAKRRTSYYPEAVRFYYPSKEAQEAYLNSLENVFYGLLTSYNTLKEYENATWHSYLEKNIYVNKYKNALNKIQNRERIRKSQISELEKFYLSTLQNKAFRNIFEIDFDDENLTHGIQYTNTVTSCIYDAQISHFCQKFIENELNNTNSYLYKAILLNQSVLHNKINENKSKLTSLINANKQSPDVIKIFSDLTSIVEQYGKYKPDGLYKSLNILVAQISGALTSIMLKSASKLQEVLVAIGIMSHQYFYYAKITDEYQVFHKKLNETVNNFSKRYTNKRAQDYQSAALLKRKDEFLNKTLFSHSVDRKVTVDVLLFTSDMSNASTHSKNVDLTLLGHQRVQEINNSAFSTFLTTIQFLASIAAINKSIKELISKKVNNNLVRDLISLGLSLGSVVCAFFEGVKPLIIAWTKTSSTVTTRFLVSTKIFSKAGNIIGVLTGLFEIYSGIQHYLESGELLESSFMIFNGILTVAIVLVASRNAIAGIILFLISIITTLIYPSILDSELEKWLKRCCLGINHDKNPKYDDIEEYKNLIAH